MSAPPPSEPDERRFSEAAAVRRGVKSALAGWFVRRARARAPAGPVPQDEATHPWRGIPGFVETYSFAAVQQDTAVITQLQWLPHQQAQRVWVIVMRPDGVWARPGGSLLPCGPQKDRWHAGELRLDCVQPLRRWAATFRGTLPRVRPMGAAPQVVPDAMPATATASVAIDLAFASERPPWTPRLDDHPELVARSLGASRWRPGLIRSARQLRRRGYGQVGTLDGVLEVDGHRIPLRAAGLRQHHWGALDWSACTEGFEGFFSAADGRQAWVYRAGSSALTIQGGVLMRRGGAEPIRSLALRTHARPHRAPSRIELSIGSLDGEAQVVATVRQECSLRLLPGRVVDTALVQTTGALPGWGLWAALRTDTAAR